MDWSKKLPDQESRNLKNNSNLLKDFEIKLWDNNSFSSLLLSSDKKLSQLIDEIAKREKWAFASDLIKVLALLKYGGWAADADNEFIRQPSPFERMSFVTGFENYNGKILPITALWGAFPRHHFTRIMKSVYENNAPDVILSEPNSIWLSRILISAGIRNDNTRQYTPQFDVHLFPHSTFCGPITEQTYALHHFNGSWI